MLKRSFILALALIIPAGSSLAGEGAVVDNEADGCTVGTVVLAFGMVPTLGQIATGEGQGVAKSDGSGKLTCRGRIEFGTDTIAAVAFLPGPTFDVPVTIPSFEEACDLLPLIAPGTACNGRGGSIVVHGEDLGIPCQDTYVNHDGDVVVRSTFNWRQVLSPSGQAKVTCHFD